MNWGEIIDKQLKDIFSIRKRLKPFIVTNIIYVSEKIYNFYEGEEFKYCLEVDCELPDLCYKIDEWDAFHFGYFHPPIGTIIKNTLTGKQGEFTGEVKTSNPPYFCITGGDAIFARNAELVIK